MNRVLDFLERHVQWLAVGLGAAYFLWMAWTHVIGTPVKVDHAGRSYSPGEIDQHVADTVVRDLHQQMQNPKVPAELVVSDWVGPFREKMALRNVEPYWFTKMWTPAAVSPRIPVTIPGLARGGGSDGTKPVVKLPELPPAVMTDTGAGASSVIPNQAAPLVVAQPQPTAPPPAWNGEDGMPHPSPQPPPTPAPAAVSAADAAGAVDKSWVTQGFRIPSADLRTAFSDVNLPKGLYRTAVLNIELQRQEKLPNDQWGPVTKVKPLAIARLNTLPGTSASSAERKAFLEWAINHQPEIIQPPFYLIAKGDPWAPPAPPQAPAPVDPALAGQPAEGEPFDPQKYVDASPAELMTLTPEQRQQVAKARMERDKERQKNRPRGGSGPRGGGGKGGSAGGGGPQGGRVIDDDERPETDFTKPLPNPFLRQDDPRDQPRINPDGTIVRPQVPGEPAAAPAGTTGGEMFCPTGEFDVSAIPDITGWAHDDTVEPGKVYRYRVVYSIKSPAYANEKYVKPAKLAETFMLSSNADNTQWGAEVRIPSRTSFWLARQFSNTAPTVKFDVFAWQGGAKLVKSFDVAPGDMIGGKLEDGTDFSTGWTLVDIARDSRADMAYVLIADSEGVLYRRDFNSDQKNPDAAADRAAAQPAAAAPAAAPGAGSVAGG